MIPDEHFMKQALREAKKSFEEKEIPVGAVITCNGQIISKAHNQTIRLNDPTAHAEIIAITSACNYLGTRYLKGCTIYITLEPCAMCAGAIFWSQIDRVVFAATDIKRGYRKFSEKIIHWKTPISNAICICESEMLIKEFFQKIRS